MEQEKRQQLTRSLRKSRSWHRNIGLALSLFVLISSLTGLLLAWKKNVDLLQPPSQKGSTKVLSEWLPIHELASKAQQALQDSIGQAIEIDRIDARPSKGMVKVLFETGNWEVQLDAGSGQTLSIAKRHADWIENLHDGSIISDSFKLLSMNVLGIGLIILVLVGLWLWYGPKRIRNARRHN